MTPHKTDALGEHGRSKVVENLPFGGLLPKDFVVYEVDVQTRVRLVLHPEVIDRVDDAWRASLYALDEREDIISHLLYNLLQGRSVDQLDGWADMPAFAAHLDEMEGVEVDIVSIEPLSEPRAGLLKWDHDRWVAAERDGGKPEGEPRG